MSIFLVYSGRQQERIGDPIMTPMDEVKKIMTGLIQGNYDPLQASLDLEWVLFKKYASLKNEDAIRTDKLLEEIPEICAEYERGENPEKFKKKIKKEYERIFV